MLTTLFSRKYILMTLLVLAAMAVMARLGVWQLDRRQQRIAGNADLVAKLDAPPISMNEVALAAAWPLPENRDAIRNVRADAAGQFDFDQQIVLLQQSYLGQPGVHLVAPLMLAGTRKAILVDRGWIPFEESQAERSSQYNADTGEVTIAGRLQPSQILFGSAAEKAKENAAAETLAKDEWYRIDVEAIQKQLPYEILPVFLLQSPGADGNVALPYRIEPEVDLSEGPHLGYALQWFAFAIIAGVVYIGVVRSRERRAQAQEKTQNQATVEEAAPQG
jgi:surfeit locus 1 family protein